MSTSGLPRGELLGRYTSYLDAQKLVDYLADNDFPVATVTIVGNDLRTVERVTAKLSYPKVALAGAAQGAMMGFFVGLLLTLFSPGTGLYQILSAIGLGMAIWMIAGVISYSMRRGKRDFASSSQFVATSYDVVVDFANAQAARALASKLPMHPGQPVAQPPVNSPAVAPAPPTAGTPTAGPATPAGAPAQDPAGGEPQSDGPSGTFPDLPDGRPRYGVRVTPPPAAADAPAEQDPNAPQQEQHTGQDHPASPAQTEPRVNLGEQPENTSQEQQPAPETETPEDADPRGDANSR